MQGDGAFESRSIFQYDERHPNLPRDQLIFDVMSMLRCGKTLKIIIIARIPATGVGKSGGGSG